MGKPIVYCHDCGKSLLEADFAAGRASQIENRPYCAACRTPVAPAPALKPARRSPGEGGPPASTRRSSKLPVVPVPRERKRASPGPLVFAGIGAGALLLLVLVAFALSGGAGAPPVEPAADPLAELQQLAASGADPDRILRKCEEVRPRVAGKPAEARLREIEGRARNERAERERARAARTTAALGRIRGIVDSDPEFLRQAEVTALYTAAMKEAGPRESDVEREWLGYERKLEAAARSAADAAKAEADRLAAAGDFAGALARLDRLSPPFRASAPGKALEARRREIEEQLRLAQLPPPPLHEASHVWKSDTFGALSDRALPKSSGDETLPRFTWWDHKGSEEWVTFGFPKRRTVSECDVYWFDDTEKGGGCRVPESWKLHYLDGEEWKEVRATSPYGVERDRMNRVAFEPVPARALRLVAKLRPNFSAGILEWSVPGTDDIPRPPAPPPPAPPPPPPPPSAEVVLDASQARVQGERIAIKEREGRKYVGNWNKAGDRVEFTARIPRAARYRVQLEYAAAPDCGGELSALFGGETLEAALAPTGDWKKYTTIPLGEVPLPAGDLTVQLLAKKVSGEGLMNLRSLRLVPQ